MKVGYVVLYQDGELVLSKDHTILSKPVEMDYGEFEDINVPWRSKKQFIVSVRILNQLKVNHMKSWFYNCEKLEREQTAIPDCCLFVCLNSLSDCSKIFHHF